MTQDRKSLMVLIGNLLKGLVSGSKFLVIIKHPDDSIDFAANNKDAIEMAVRFIEIIETDKTSKQ